MAKQNRSTWHMLSEIDPEARTATCSICGPVKVYRGSRGKWRCAERRKMIGRESYNRSLARKGKSRKYTKGLTLEVRFAAKAIQGEHEDDCWGWADKIRANGYVQMNNGKRSESVPAHRVSYALHVGTIPAGWEIHHTCGTRHCTNPKHLKAVPAGSPHAQEDKQRKHQAIDAVLDENAALRATVDQLQAELLAARGDVSSTLQPSSALGLY